MAQGIPGSLRPRIILTFRHYKGGSSSAKRTGRLYSRRNPWYSLSEAESTSGHMVLSRDTTEKIPSDTTGNRSRDRPTSSTLTTTLPQAPETIKTHILCSVTFFPRKSRRLLDNVEKYSTEGKANDDNMTHAL